MSAIDYGLRQVDAAFRLLLFDQAGMDQFDTSMSGFWRSFAAAAAAFPLALWMAAQQPEMAAAIIEEPVAVPSWGLYLTVEALAFVLAWLAFPLAMIPLSRVFGFTQRYVPLIIAYNWSSLLIFLVYLPFYLLFELGVLEIGLFFAFQIVLLFLLIGYRWFVVKTALEAAKAPAFAFVVLELVLAWLIGFGADSLHGVA
jgi:hypothetical protein